MRGRRWGGLALLRLVARLLGVAAELLAALIGVVAVVRDVGCHVLGMVGAEAALGGAGHHDGFLLGILSALCEKTRQNSINRRFRQGVV